MRLLATTLAALALAAAAGCGGDDEEGAPIPQEQADAMLEQLDVAETRVDEGRCESARFQVTGDGALEDKVAALPEDVDGDVRSALEDSLDRLAELIEDQCGQEEPDTDTTETEAPETDTEETEPDTDTQETETQPTETQETQPPQTETQESPPEVEQPPLPNPDEDGGTTAPDGGGTPSPNAGAGRRG